MPTTKYKIAEQVLILAGGGDPKQADTLKLADVKELIGQVINELLKVSYFQTALSNGERIPEGSMLATYENIDVVSLNGRSKAVLPAIPQQLVKGIGLYQVSPQDNWGCQYIPIPPGHWWMIQKEGLLSDLMGLVGYENFGTDVIFTKDITTDIVPVNKVMVRMAIVDISRLSDYDLLPIPADMEAQVIKEVYNIITGKRDRLNVVDPTAENKGVKP